MFRTRPIEEGDWILMYDSSLDNQHSSFRRKIIPLLMQTNSTLYVFSRSDDEAIV